MGEINVSSSTYAQGVYNAYQKADDKDVKAEKEVSKAKAESEGVVYEPSKKDDAKDKVAYSINKMSAEDRAALVKQLKDDQTSRQQSLMDIAKQMMTGQAGTFAIATGNNDDIWKFLASGDYTVDEAAKIKAQEDISEDGYWGVKQTSQRLFDFASALAGDDVEQMKKMQSAMEKGYKEATKAWGKALPDISKKTLDAANKLFEDYYAYKASETAQ